MAWKFSKRIKIIPGIHLNISTKGISTTIGIRGASVNIGPKGTFLNTSIPGTGIYNRQKISGSSIVKAPLAPAASSIPITPPVAENPVNSPSTFDNIFSLDANEITSNDMQGIKDAILMAHQQRKELATDRVMVMNEWNKNEKRLSWSYWLLYGFILKQQTLALKADIKQQQVTIAAIDMQLKNSAVALDFNFDEGMHFQYHNMFKAFEKLCASEKVWDITSTHANDRFTTRSAATFTIKRLTVKFRIGQLPDITSKTPAMIWQNANGADLYFYPNFMIVWNSRDHFAIVGYNELDINYITTRFIEDENVPKDSVIVDKTWHKVNKNGQPDQRFRDNYQIPIVHYGDIELKTLMGLNERYLFSNDKGSSKKVGEE